jgi:hypothetical protein
MHFKTEKSDFPIAVVDGFLKGKANVLRLNESEIELNKAGLQATPQIAVLKPAL